MGKTYEKFVAEHKKLKASYKGIDDTGKTNAAKALKAAMTNRSQGEDYLRSELAKARKAGITGDTQGDFAKAAGVMEAVKLMQTAADALDDEIQKMDALAATGADGLGKFQALLAEIGKDLGKRSDSSKSKKDIDALEKAVDDDCKQLLSASKASQTVRDYDRAYGKGLKKAIANIFAEDADAVADQVDRDELPEKLRDRVLKGNLGRCTKFAKDIKQLCDDAVSKASDKDMKGAVGSLKAAKQIRDTLVETTGEYAKISKDAADFIKSSKDSKKITDAIDQMKYYEQGTGNLIRKVVETLQHAN